MPQPVNKVAQRYRQMIVDAFLSLCHTYSYNEITILMITQEADVSRQTFYRHFKTKDDIIYYCLDSLSADLIHRLHNRTDASVRDILLAYFTFWRDNVAAFRTATRAILQKFLWQAINSFTKHS